MCDKIHTEYDRYANSHVQVGELPAWMRVKGRVVWYVFQGPYSQLPGAWNDFWVKVRAANVGELAGPPGDVYVCSPEEHKGKEANMTTILWAPLKD
jgi:hypothetical protein